MPKIASAFLIIGLCLTAYGAAATDCDVSGLPINRSWELEAEDGSGNNPIVKCMQEGKPMPAGWTRNEGMSMDVGGHEGGVGPVIPYGMKAANSAPPYYSGAAAYGCGYIESGAKPGGASDSGADNACADGSGVGAGGQMYNLPTIKAFSPQVVNRDASACVGGLTANFTANPSGACLKAALNFCGVGGTPRANLCTTGSPRIPPSSTPPLHLGPGGELAYVTHVNISIDPTYGISRPVGVAQPTQMLLDSGRIVTVPGGTLVTALPGKVKVTDFGSGRTIATYNTNIASLAVPSPSSLSVDNSIADTPYMQSLLEQNKENNTGPPDTSYVNNSSVASSMPCLNAGTCGVP